MSMDKVVLLMLVLLFCVSAKPVESRNSTNEIYKMNKFSIRESQTDLILIDIDRKYEKIIDKLDNRQ